MAAWEDDDAAVKTMVPVEPVEKRTIEHAFDEAAVVVVEAFAFAFVVASLAATSFATSLN